MRRFVILLAAALTIAIGLVGCAAPQGTAPQGSASAAPQVQRITPQQAKERLDAGEDITLVDVRTAEEYAEGHIEGSVLLPVDTVAADAEELLPDKDAALFVYCRSGRRSALAAAQLLLKDYTNVYDLGGINSWPYEIVK